jgi:2-keto-4-pentenoate hydratase
MFVSVSLSGTAVATSPIDRNHEHMTPEQRIAAAEALRVAERDRMPIGPLTVEYPGMDTDDAYEIQLINVGKRVDNGHVVRGHKVGLTSKAMQEMLGVNEPDYGHLFDDMFVFEDFDINTEELCQPRVEIEIGFILGGPLRGSGCNVADVLLATAYVVPAIEIIDSRIADWKITLADTIADNASSARLVLGGRATPISEVDLRSIEASLLCNGVVADTGLGAAVLGNPATAVAWLANKVSAFGVSLEAGHVILPGSCTRAFDVAAGDRIRADFDILGSVGVSFK